MGGNGSGRICDFFSQSLVEDQDSLDIRWLKKQGGLRPGAGGFISWAPEGQKRNSISYLVESQRMILRYFYSDSNVSNEKVVQVINLVSTPCNYGGFRPWFKCPGCGRRVAILYAKGKYFLCRYCHGLAYACQRETKPFRLVRKAQKIRKRLGASLSTAYTITEKPKGMHRKTFERLKDKAHGLSEEIMLAFLEGRGFSP